ncbi:hypothetical protein [Undibacterium umbellatum]|jgi:hypothetical protein|uniref:Transmembrane protein n=2 Tax=Oxalobacteraceae TaxID=75682 RepID=A0ABR6ZG70_9BURK|nr:hypothetical protein [Undibacterium umbellatum]MBC3910556.1 hypothetical protein [Undibacterium umbellatum]
MSSDTDNKFLTLCRAAYKRQGMRILCAAGLIAAAASYRSKQFDVGVMLKLLLVTMGFFLVAVVIEWLRARVADKKE